MMVVDMRQLSLHKAYEIGGGGVSLHWSEIDEDLSVANLMAGADWRST